MAESTKHVYDESKIKTLSSLEHIRLRTGMYIGRIGPLTLAAVLALCAYFAWANAKHERSQETDTDGISLLIDESGLYLGGSSPSTTAWQDIREVSRPMA